MRRLVSSIRGGTTSEQEEDAQEAGSAAIAAKLAGGSDVPLPQKQNFGDKLKSLVPTPVER